MRTALLWLGLGILVVVSIVTGQSTIGQWAFTALAALGGVLAMGYFDLHRKVKELSERIDRLQE